MTKSGGTDVGWYSSRWFFRRLNRLLLSFFTVSIDFMLKMIIEHDKTSHLMFWIIYTHSKSIIISTSKIVAASCIKCMKQFSLYHFNPFCDMKSLKVHYRITVPLVTAIVFAIIFADCSGSDDLPRIVQNIHLESVLIAKHWLNL